MAPHEQFAAIPSQKDILLNIVRHPIIKRGAHFLYFMIITKQRANILDWTSDKLGAGIHQCNRRDLAYVSDSAIHIDEKRKRNKRTLGRIFK